MINAHLPNVFYNVRTGYTQFKIRDDGSMIEYTTSVSVGQYSLQGLMDAVGAAINADGGIPIVFVSAVENAVTRKGEMTFDRDVTVISSSSDNPLAFLLGFDAKEGVTATSQASVLAAPFIPRLQGVKTAYIHIPELSLARHTLDRDQDAHYIAGVPMDVEFGEIAHYSIKDPHTNLIEFHSPRGISTLSVSIRDSRGIVLDTHQHEWSCIIKIYYSL